MTMLFFGGVNTDQVYGARVRRRIFQAMFHMSCIGVRVQSFATQMGKHNRDGGGFKISGMNTTKWMVYARHLQGRIYPTATISPI
jgi:hypothetical protein